MNNRKLTEEKVMAILNDSRSNRQLAKLYGVSHETIGKIKRRESWKHLRSATCAARVATMVVTKH